MNEKVNSIRQIKLQLTVMSVGQFLLAVTLCTAPMGSFATCNKIPAKEGNSQSSSSMNGQPAAGDRKEPG